MSKRNPKKPPFLDIQVPEHLRKEAIKTIDGVISARTYSSETSLTVIPSLDGDKEYTLDELRAEIEKNSDKGKVAAIAWSRHAWKEKQ